MKRQGVKFGKFGYTINFVKVFIYIPEPVILQSNIYYFKKNIKNLLPILKKNIYG